MPSGAEQFRDWMDRKGFTGRAAAEFLGWEESFVNKLARGVRRPGTTNAVRLEELTGIPCRAWVSSPIDKLSGSNGRRARKLK